MYIGYAWSCVLHFCDGWFVGALFMVMDVFPGRVCHPVLCNSCASHPVSSSLVNSFTHQQFMECLLG